MENSNSSKTGKVQNHEETTFNNHTIPQDQNGNPQDDTKQEKQESGLSVPGLVVAGVFILFGLFLVLNTFCQKDSIEYIYSSKNAFIFSYFSQITICFGAAVLLWIRSCMPNLTILRGFLIVLGSFFLFPPIVIISIMVAKHGLSYATLSYVFISTLSIIPIVYGFKTTDKKP